MREYKNLFWDLDGTILNSLPGCSVAFASVFNHYGLDIPNVNYANYIGPPLITTFLKLLGDVDMANEAVELYRVPYKNSGLTDQLFDGICDVLTAIRAKGYYMCIATSKGQATAIQILESLGVAHLFDDICGANYDEGRIEKEQVLEYAIARSGADKSSALMIGDSVYDVRGAKYVGIDCLACVYGFGDIVEMRAEGIVAECDSVAGLVDLF